MPVMAIYEFDDVTPEEYRDFREKLPLHAAPKGALVHACARDDDGFTVFEVWENRVALERFLEEILAPSVRRMGYPLTLPRIVEVEDFVVTKDARASEIPIGDILAAAF